MNTSHLFFIYLFCWQSVRSLSFCTQFIQYVLPFALGTNKIKYCFSNSNTIAWVAAISAGRSLEGQQTIFYFRPETERVFSPRVSDYVQCISSEIF